MAHPYFKAAALAVDVADPVVSQVREVLAGAIDSTKWLAPTPAERDALYRYRVPKLSTDGVCSMHDQLAPEPYDLEVVIGRRDERLTRSLRALGVLVETVMKQTQTDWVGVYQKRRVASGPALVKLAYRGVPSRAEFPLTEAFAAKSNNTAVGLSGKARLINDVNAHVRQGGAYYECDPNVSSEICLPIFESDGSTCGIIDAESTRSAHFTPERLAWFVALALEAPLHFPR
jgi:L-methionine (R)-S-oxide reductase